MQATRVAALQQLHQALYTPSTQAESLQKLNVIWPRLVALLWDSQPAVCASAAGPAGALGALAAQAAAAQQAQRGIANSAGRAWLPICFAFDVSLSYHEGQRPPLHVGSGAHTTICFSLLLAVSCNVPIPLACRWHAV